MFRRRTHHGLEHEVTSIFHDILGGETAVTVGHDKESATEHRTAIQVGMTVAEAEEWLLGLPEYAEMDDPGQDAIDLLDDILPLLTDEQAERVSHAFPVWAVDTSYSVADRVRYASKLYRCVQAHTSQDGYAPDQTPALWVRTAPEGEVPEWVQPVGTEDAYDLGDRVTHNGKTWVSTYDGKNVWEPGVYGWEEVAS